MGLGNYGDIFGEVSASSEVASGLLGLRGRHGGFLLFLSGLQVGIVT